MSETGDVSAIRSLMNWVQNASKPGPFPSEADIEHAKATGVMFDPLRLKHNDIVALCLTQREQIDAQRVSDAFVSSLGNRSLSHRSFLPSFAVARSLEPHRAIQGECGDRCAYCGLEREGAILLSRNHFNYLKLKWGGTLHHDLGFIAFDLGQAIIAELPAPMASDRHVLISILNAAESVPDHQGSSTLAKALAGVFPSNLQERRIVVEMLAVIGVLQPKEFSSWFDGFIPHVETPGPPTARNDWQFPAAWWKGSDGVREDAVGYWFPWASRKAKTWTAKG